LPKYIDESGDIRWTRIVYVIELDEEACADRRSPCQGARCGRIPVYVGQTCLTAEDRFAQHQAGVRASRFVRDYGIRLRPRLAGAFGEMATSRESEAAEHEVARRLRNRGKGERYCVYGGH
jgi:hypothetical protein